MPLLRRIYLGFFLLTAAFAAFIGVLAIAAYLKFGLAVSLYVLAFQTALVLVLLFAFKHLIAGRTKSVPILLSRIVLIFASAATVVFVTGGFAFGGAVIFNTAWTVARMGFDEIEIYAVIAFGVSALLTCILGILTRQNTKSSSNSV